MSHDGVVIRELSGDRRRIPCLWLFLLLTPIVSFAFAQTLFYIALLLSDPQYDSRADLRPINARIRAKGPSITIIVLSCAYLSAFGLPYAYETRAFLWVFLIAYAIPLILTYLPQRRDAVEANWRLIIVMSVVLYSYQLSIAVYSHAGGRGKRTIADVIFIVYDLQWTWAAHPVTRALGYDLFLSAVTLVYWSSIQTAATIVPADLTERSADDRTKGMSNTRIASAHSGYKSSAIVALVVVFAGLGAGSAYMYQA